MAMDISIRIFVLRQKSRPTQQAGFDKDFKTPCRRLSTGIIAIKQRYNVPCVPSQDPNVIRRQSCSQGRNGIAETKLMKCHDIQIPFHHNHTIDSSDSFFRLVQAI